MSCTTHQGNNSVETLSEMPQQAELKSKVLSGEHQESEQDQSQVENLFEISQNHLANPQVQKWISYFRHDGYEMFQSFLSRGLPYKKFIQSELAKQGLPIELYYLAMIESGFKLHAKSRAKAVGMWQFMASTGRRYGLQVDAYIDERRDPLKATYAAMNYLGDLHRVYQSWWLAIAAYNSGEYRVLRAIMKKNTRDYFELIDQKALPRETRNYVPKFIAAMIVGENAEYYGFSLDHDTQKFYQPLKDQTIPPGVTMGDLVKLADCKKDALKDANPHLTQHITHSRLKTSVYFPSDCADNEFSLEKLAHIGKKRLIVLRKQRSYYRVRRGDSLMKIARKHHTSVGALKKLNRLSTHIIYPGQRIKLVSGGWIKHRVRAGENLHKIAKKYQTTIRKIKRDNELRRSTIFPGQVIRVASL